MRTAFRGGSFLLLILVVMAACDLGDFIVRALIALGEAPVTEVRIAGTSFISFAKKDSKDGFSASDGFMCVVHNPGCGIVGNSGTDQFFGPNKPLPILSQIVAVDFTPIAPPGMAPSATGGLGGWGSFGAEETNGSADGQTATSVSWNNACQGSYAGKNLFYRMSFRVRVRGDLAQLNEPTFDPSATPTATCGDGQAMPLPAKPMASGFLGVVKVCNPGTQQTSGTLILTAACNPAQAGAPFACTMNESIPISFLPSAGGQPSSTSFMTKQVYQQGAWTISKAQVQGLTGLLPGLPLNVQVPGGVGTPVLDFSGGSCR